MSTSNISNHIEIGGSPLTGITVVAELQQGFFLVGGSEIVGYRTATTDGSGNYTLPLERQSNILPAGSYWLITENVPNEQGGPREWSIYVPDSDSTVYACLISALTPPPTPIPPPDQPYLTGRWDDMQATSPLIPSVYFRCTDQGLTYRSNGAEWVYAYGLEGDVYPTTYGALPNDTDHQYDTTNAVRNGAAFEAAKSVAFADVNNIRRIVWFSTSVGSQYPINNGHEIVGSEIAGEGGGLPVNIQVDSHKPMLISDSLDNNAIYTITGGGGVLGTTTLRNLVIEGHNIAVKAHGTAHLLLDDVDLYADAVVNGDNAALYIENSFWIDYIRGGLRNGGSASRSHPCIRIVASNDGPGPPIKGIGQSFFRHLRPNFGSILFDNRCTAGGPGNISQAAFYDVVSEGQDIVPMFDFITNVVATQQHLINLDVDHVERADAAGGNEFIRIDGLWLILSDQIKSTHGYTTYMVGCYNGGDFSGPCSDYGYGSGLIFDPAHEPANGGNVVTGGIITNAGAINTLIKTTPIDHGGGLSNAGEAYLHWGVNAIGKFLFGSGSAEADVFLRRSGVGVLAIDSPSTGQNPGLLFTQANGANDRAKFYWNQADQAFYFLGPNGNPNLTFKDNKAITFPSAASGAGFNIPPGAAPTSPANGDMWSTAAGFFARVAGVTKQFTLV